MTNPQFRKFRIDWDVYKKLVDIHPAQLAVHLYNCCDSTVQNSFINTTSNFFNLNETEMLLHIESTVTSQSNPSVHRMTFSAITRSEGETMQNFLVRLRSTAQDCEFSCPSCHFDLQSINVKDQFTRGLYNETLQTDILAKAGHLNTLGQIVKHAEAFESALRDQLQLQHSSETAARFSEYRRSKYNKTQIKTNRPCNGCGSHDHDALQRSTNCPAWGKQCLNCNKYNHFAKVCRHSKKDTISTFLVAHEYDEPSNTYRPADKANIVEIPAQLTVCTKNRISVTHLFLYPFSLTVEQASA